MKFTSCTTKKAGLYGHAAMVCGLPCLLFMKAVGLMVRRIKAVFLPPSIIRNWGKTGKAIEGGAQRWGVLEGV